MVTYTVYTNNTCTTAATTQISGQPAAVTVAGGVVPDSASVTFNQAGTYFWQAVYSGDSNNQGSSRHSTRQTVAVASVPTTLVTMHTSNSILVGASVHASASVRGQSAGAFFLMIRRPPSSTLCPYTTLFRSSGQPAAVTVAGGVVPDSASVTFNQAGTYFWQAVYSGDSNNQGSSSLCTSETVEIGRAPCRERA